jgi:hypothetical protein
VYQQPTIKIQAGDLFQYNLEVGTWSLQQLSTNKVTWVTSDTMFVVLEDAILTSDWSYSTLKVMVGENNIVVNRYFSPSKLKRVQKITK